MCCVREGVVFSVVLRQPCAGQSVPVAVGVWRQIARKHRLVPLSLLAAVMLAGCATTGQDLTANATKAAAKQVAHSAVRAHAPRRPAAAKPAKPIPLPAEALLKRQPPPECELKTQPAGTNPADVKLMTLDYERQCYKQVEGIVRTRLDTLQDAVGETIKAVKGNEAAARGR